MGEGVKRSVLVTGGKGYLGRHVVAALRDAGHRVRSLDRRAGDEQTGVEYVRMDLRTDDLGGAFDGVDVLVHLAATMRGSDDEVIAGTVETTRRLLDAMAHSACRRIILAGSFSVYDWSRVDGEISEQSPTLDEHTMQSCDAYARAKTTQERLARDVARQHGWSLAILRPAVIHGDGVTGSFLLGKRIGPVQFVVAPRAMARLAHVGRVARAFVDAVETDAPGVTVRNVIDPPTTTTWAYARSLGGVTVPVPYALGKAVAAIAGTLTGGSTRLPYFLQPKRYEAMHKPVRWTEAGRG